MWIVYAIMSAVFAAITSIFAKIGINGINSNLATAIRTIVVLILAWGIVFTTGTHKDIKNISNKSMLFLILSGLATGLSWLFYYKAIQMGQVTSVVAIDKLSIIITIVLAFFILNEQITVKSIFGGILIAAGTLIMVL
ncbi:EamA family transporter [Clostridium sardiniense]|uniref:EamA family transporter n=1 Tax=Clostridium sardiniense TaxID=29369 RepID=A0ABS7KW10_CLOSR|nr:EamA family transporter [Clostridium sardiniense]MBM7834222.1 transporter family protein [Clostridium sardiniense]MBY0755001.1 EamA family transporter [Clostridium sardiniense]MDQ0459145.1 transporter family protein [Clostridium sardiniense]